MTGLSRAAGHALARAQRLARAGRVDEAAHWFRQATTLAPEAVPVAVQEALALARNGRVGAALDRLRELPSAAATDPAAQLFRGWLLARAGLPDAALELLDPLAEAAPEQQVVATARAYALLRAGREAEALSALGGQGGDNHELLSWVWLELERAWLRRPLAAARVVPPGLPPPASPRVARRWFRAAVAATQGNTNCVLRRRWVAAAAAGQAPAVWLRGLWLALERRWPTDPLAALLAVRAGGHELPGLAFQLGAQLVDQGYWAAGLAELDRAIEEMAASPELYLPLMFRAAGLVELRRFAEAASALAAVARLDAVDAGDGGATHEFALPHWYYYRARVRVAGGDDPGARADFERALAGEPALFDDRLRLQSQAV